MSKKRLYVQTTTDYAMFVRSTENRPADMKGRASLVASMRKYGFLECFPVVCVRNARGQLIVKDGQHRCTIAMKLGLPVSYVEADADFDVAEVNGTAKKWRLIDYARKWAENGKADYQAGLDFADKWGVNGRPLAVGVSFALLAGTTGFSGCTQRQFVCGEFTVKEPEWAEAVASLYRPLIEMKPELHKTGFMEACMAVCRVADFDAKRLLRKAAQQRDKLVNYASRDDYLKMLEVIYNFNVGATKMAALAFEAQKIMAERDAAAAKARRARSAVAGVSAESA